MKEWTAFNTLTRCEAIEMLIGVTDKDDPYWETVTCKFYDEKNDTMPTLDDILKALGVSDEELREAWAS